jgi:hypothetical protein
MATIVPEVAAQLLLFPPIQLLLRIIRAVVVKAMGMTSVPKMI